MNEVKKIIKLSEEEYKYIVMKEKINMMFFTEKNFKKYDFSDYIYFNKEKPNNLFKVTKIIKYDPLEKDENYHEVIRLMYLAWCVLNKKEVENIENYLDIKEFKQYLYITSKFIHAGKATAVLFEKVKQ